MQLKIQNMTCGGCARAVKTAIFEIDSAAVIHADPATRTVEVESTLPLADIRNTLIEAGYPPTSIE